MTFLSPDLFERVLHLSRRGIRSIYGPGRMSGRRILRLLHYGLERVHDTSLNGF